MILYSFHKFNFRLSNKKCFFPSEIQKKTLHVHAQTLSKCTVINRKNCSVFFPLFVFCLKHKVFGRDHRNTHMCVHKRVVLLCSIAQTFNMNNMSLEHWYKEVRIRHVLRSLVHSQRRLFVFEKF